MALYDRFNKGKGGKKPRRKKSELQTWVNKLDRLLSLYVRMRDSREFNYTHFRCISCGRILPIDQADCGHFHSRVNMSLRFDTRNCNAECRFCLTPDALILKKDLKWVPLGELREGDRLFAFSEESVGRSDQRRHWEESIVTHLHRDFQEVFDVELENGDHVKTTAEHKWIVRNRTGCGWLSTKDMWINGKNMYGNKKTGPHTKNVTTVVCKPIQVVYQDLSYDSGWLAGMIDADGHLTQQNIHNADGTIRYGFRIGVAQCDKYPEIQKKIISLIEKFTNNNKPCRQSMDKSTKKTSIKSNYALYQYLVTGSNMEKVQFLMRIRPHKLSKLNINKLGMVRSKYDTKVKSITPIGKREIVVMETSSHTFIANGYMMHNCNRMSSDHLIGYRKNLVMKLGMLAFKQKYPNEIPRMEEVKRLGEQQLDLMDVEKHQTKKWSVFELQQLYQYYAALIVKMKEEM